VTDFSAPVPLLKKESDPQNTLYARQPSIVQRFLTGQAQQFAEDLIMLENAFTSKEKR
jgi:hypothetical protein